jgi:polynucleotide 5'-hydroxyl-kinase GRC3/NOL9
MISAVAARRAAAATAAVSASTSSSPAPTSAPVTGSQDDNDEELQASLKRSKPPTPAATRNAKKMKLRAEHEGVKGGKGSSTRRDGRKTTKHQQQQQPRYFSTTSSSKDSKGKKKNNGVQEDKFRDGKDLIEVESDSEEGSSEGDDEELTSSSSDAEEEEGVTLLQVTSKRQQPRNERMDKHSSSSDEDGMDVDITVDDLTNFSVLGPTTTTTTTSSISIAQPPSNEHPVLSTFDPIFEENVFRLSLSECAALGVAEGASVVLLQPHEMLCLLGTCSLKFLYGQIEMLGTTLSAEGASIAHRIFAPSSTPLPVLRCAFSSSSSTSPRPALPSTLPQRIQSTIKDDTTLLKSGAVFVFAPLHTGVEKLGLVCRLFEGVFVPSKWQRQLNGRKGGHVGVNGDGEGADEGGLGVEGLYIVHRQSRDVVPFVLPTSWSEALDEVLSGSSFSSSTALSTTIFNITAETASPAFLVKGPRNSGKSTFARTLLNRLLEKHERVAFLECDLGQSEFTTSGMVSLNVVNESDGRVFGASRDLRPVRRVKTNVMHHPVQAHHLHTLRYPTQPTM